MSGPEFGYFWMKISNFSFGIGEIDGDNQELTGLVCRMNGDMGITSDAEFRYCIYNDLNGDGQAQPSEILAQDQLPVPPTAEGVHLKNIELEAEPGPVRLKIGAYRGEQTLASYHGDYR